MVNTDKLSPESYEALARRENESGIRAQNEASYNFEGADPEVDWSWASQYQRMADLIRERVRADNSEAGDEVRDKAADIEALKSGVIVYVKILTQLAPTDVDEERQSIFRKTRSETSTHTRTSPNSRTVDISDIRQTTSFLGAKSGESRKLRVTEYDGTKEGHLHQYEPYALVATHFDIDPHTSELTVTQEVSPVVLPEHKAIFPRLGIDTKSPDEQWSRLEEVLSQA